MHQGKISLGPDPSFTKQREFKKHAPFNRFCFAGGAQRAYIRSKSNNAKRDNERPLTNIVNVAKVLIQQPKPEESKKPPTNNEAALINTQSLLMRG